MSESFSIHAEGIQNLSPVSDYGLADEPPDWSNESIPRADSTAYLRDDFLDQARVQLMTRIGEGIKIETERLNGTDPSVSTIKLIIDNEIAFGPSLRGIPHSLVAPIQQEMITVFTLPRS